MAGQTQAFEASLGAELDCGTAGRRRVRRGQDFAGISGVGRRGVGRRPASAVNSDVGVPGDDLSSGVLECAA